MKKKIGGVLLSVGLVLGWGMFCNQEEINRVEAKEEKVYTADVLSISAVGTSSEKPVAIVIRNGVAVAVRINGVKIKKGVTGKSILDGKVEAVFYEKNVYDKYDVVELRLK